MPEPHRVSLELDEALYDRLAQAAAQRSVAPSEAASDAIAAWLNVDAWQREEIAAALLEADAGDFASDAEVQAVMTRWKAAGAE